jgi:type VI protein secretion system component Hcp
MGFSHHYLKLTAKSGSAVEGEATKPGFEKQIEITDWNWTVQYKAKLEDESGAARGLAASRDRIEPGILSLSKPPDRSSVRLLKAMHEGEIFTSAEFTLFEELQGQREQTGGAFHLVVKLTEVSVLKYELSGSTSEKEVTTDESWDFDYKTVEFKYDKGAQQVMLTRPPGASNKSSQSKSDEIEEQFKSLDPKERPPLLKKLGDLK